MWIDLLNAVHPQMRLWRWAALAAVGFSAVFGVAYFLVGTSAVERFGSWMFGGDFIILYASGQLILSGHGAQVHETMPYPAAVLTPMLPLSLLPLYMAFFVWSLLCTILFGLALWRLSRATRIPTWLLWLWLLGSPFFYSGLLVGQVHAFLFLAMTEFVLALRSDRERAAGLWLSLLLIKPQFLPLFGLFLVWKRRWNTLFYALIGGSLFIALSFALVGLEGLRAQFLMLLGLASESSFTSCGAVIMTNWRALAVTVAGWLGLGFGEMAVAIALLSIATAVAAILPWRGRSWPTMNPGERDWLLLGLTAAALLVGYNTHLHSDVLVIAPALLVISATPSTAGARQVQRAALALLLVPSLLVPVVALATGQLVLAYEVASFGVILLLLLVLVLVVEIAWSRSRQPLTTTDKGGQTTACG